MKFVHIALNARATVDGMSFKEHRAALEKLFWSDHSYPEKPDTASDAPEAAEAKKAAYKQAKAAVQLDWCHILESWTVMQIDAALKAAAYDPSDKNCLYLITLPESYWTDIELPGRKHMNEEGTAISGYANPFYEATVQDLFFHPASPGTLAGLSAGNVAVFGGTIWWKMDIDGMETIFNTVPVFHAGSCCFAWDKQLLSRVDGLGCDRQASKLHKWFDVRSAAFGNAGLTASTSSISDFNNAALAYVNTQKKGFLSPLTEALNPRRVPSCVLALSDGTGGPAVPVDIGVDICLDFIAEISRKLLTAPPLVQVVLANDASYSNPESFYSTKYCCICDMTGRSITAPAVNLTASESPAAHISNANSSRLLSNTFFTMSRPLDLY